ncbi:MAG: hypothetical protein JWN98_2516 [Abditibacteriota bacterium]|nr:hypothetical protein [Abditibacteriota bacterium]
MTNEPYTITDNLDELLAVLPNGIANAIAPADRARLVEIVLDLGRKPEARFVDHYEYLREALISSEELDYVEARLGAFGDDNRAGIPATLHRISAIRNRRGAIVGLTLRVGRAVTGIVDILRDLIASGESLLLMGRPGLGKTTLLREMARVMADEEGKRVVIVDTSNEIAGDGDVPHPAIGRARRMQVPKVSLQHVVMIEAVENHMPEVVVIDEIGRLEETLAARTIAERGVQLIATVHGNTLDNLLANPAMSDLIGGIGSVTLSDEEARRRRTQKTVLERKSPPTFTVVVEMIERDRIAVRRPVGEVVDALLRGQPVPPEERFRDENGDIQIEQAPAVESLAHPHRDFEMRGDTPFNERGGNRYDTRSSGRGDRSERRGPRGMEARHRDDHRTRDGGVKAAGRREAKGSPSNRPSDGSSSRIEDDESSFEGWIARHALPPLPHQKRATGSEAATPSIPASGTTTQSTFEAASDEFEDDGFSDVLETDEQDGHDVDTAPAWVSAPIDPMRVRRIYPFGVSRSRLARALKQLGLSITLSRSWHDADAVLMLSGRGGISTQSSLLREARELKLPIVGVKGNTYAQIMSRLNDIFGNPAAAKASTASGRNQSDQSPREIATQEARNAAQRVLKEAGPVELRPQGKTLRRLQHQLAERYHLRSYSVGREPNRRVRFLPTIRQ